MTNMTTVSSCRIKDRDCNNQRAFQTRVVEIQYELDLSKIENDSRIIALLGDAVEQNLLMLLPDLREFELPNASRRVGYREAFMAKSMTIDLESLVALVGFMSCVTSG